MLRAYRVAAALNLTTSSAGTRPRSFTSMPCALAHSRTSVLSTPSARALRPLLGDTPERTRQLDAFGKLDTIMATGKTSPSINAADIVLATMRKGRR